MNAMNYGFFIVVSGTTTFTFANLADPPVLPLVGERIRVPSGGVTWDYTVDSKVITTQLVSGVCYNTVQLNCHITII